MRFAIAERRLSALPATLPAPADVLMPVLIGDTAATGDPRGRMLRPGVGEHRPRAAAVLVLVYPDRQGEGRLVLIERQSYNGHHSGEVSFPGGKAEAGDADDAATAIREATEEVALDPVQAGVTVVGRLDPVWIPVSDFQMTPIVAVATRAPRLAAHPGEVARIVEPPLSRFLPSAPIEVVERTIGEWPLRYGHYDLDGLSVWGATARVLSQLGAVLGD